MSSPSQIIDFTLADALDRLAKKDVSAVELAEAHLEQMARHRSLNAFLVETPERALNEARASDERRAKGDAKPLDGIPLGIKDLFCTKGVETTAGSKILEGFVPTYESTVTANLWRDGAVMLGKLNMDEFAMGSSNMTSAYGPVENPWQRPGSNAKLVPGGSSGGSASAVAARMALGATGTDTGGSIRQPAAFCGIVGIKPTYGRCSRWGTIAFASSLDQAGSFARTVKDTAILLRSMSGFDPKDSTSVDMPVPDWAKDCVGNVRGMRIGIPRQYRMDGMPAEIDRVWNQGAQWLRDAGAEIVEIDLPHTKYALPTYYVVAPAECSSNLARYDGVRYGHRGEGASLTELYENSRAEGFGAEVKRRIMIGTYVLSAGYYDAYYLKAQQVRALIARDFALAFDECDAILTPTAPSTAFAIGEKMDDPIAMYLNDVFTVPASLAGLPGISVPAGLGDDGLPLGLQVLGKPFDESGVFRVAQAIEDAARFDAKPALLKVA